MASIITSAAIARTQCAVSRISSEDHSAGKISGSQSIGRGNQQAFGIALTIFQHDVPAARLIQVTRGADAAVVNEGLERFQPPGSDALCPITFVPARQSGRRSSVGY